MKKEYETVIEFIDGSRMYRAHVREVGTIDFLYSTGEYTNTLDALNETQGFFVLQNIGNPNFENDGTINSSLKDFNGGIQEPERKCCGR